MTQFIRNAKCSNDCGATVHLAYVRVGEKVFCCRTCYETWLAKEKEVQHAIQTQSKHG